MSLFDLAHRIDARTPPPIHTWRIALLAFALAAYAPFASAAAPVAGTSWDALSADDRDALVQPLRDRWERASPEQQQRMLDRARFWASLSPEQKRMARAGVERYRNASPEQRQRMREAWQRRQQERRERRD